MTSTVALNSYSTLNESQIWTPPTQAPQTSRKKVIPLTSVRGIAALMIYALHIWRIDLREPLVVENLRCVVTLFFVLSGYMMVYCYHTCTFQQWKCKISFMVRRFARIYPPLMFAYFWCIAILTSDNGLQANVLRLATTPVLIYSLVACMESRFFGDFTHHWAVSVEFLFYLLLIFLFPAFRYAYEKSTTLWRWWVTFWILAPAALYTWIVAPIFLSFTEGFPKPYTNRACQLYLLLPFRLPECLLGVWIGYLALRYVHPAWERASESVRGSIAILSDVTLGVIGIVVVYLFPKLDAMFNTHLVNYSHSGLLAPFAMLTVLLLSLDTGYIASIMRWRPLEVLGEISYELYLIHFSVVATMSKILGMDLNISNYGFIITLPVTLLVSYALARYYSEPLFKQIVAVVARKWPTIKCTCMLHTHQLLPTASEDRDRSDSLEASDGNNEKVIGESDVEEGMLNSSLSNEL